ncbi:MAG: hypothetical protein M1831_005208 [Alyxoria varia]|nr:MAG: hypothetical protein M1831_005208 [Alyxoria varia]
MASTTPPSFRSEAEVDFQRNEQQIRMSEEYNFIRNFQNPEEGSSSSTNVERPRRRSIPNHVPPRTISPLNGTTFYNSDDARASRASRASTLAGSTTLISQSSRGPSRPSTQRHSRSTSPSAMRRYRSSKRHNSPNPRLKAKNAHRSPFDSPVSERSRFSLHELDNSVPVYGPQSKHAYDGDLGQGSDRQTNFSYEDLQSTVPDSPTEVSFNGEEEEEVEHIGAHVLPPGKPGKGIYQNPEDYPSQICIEREVADSATGKEDSVEKQSKDENVADGYDEDGHYLKPLPLFLLMIGLCIAVFLLSLDRTIVVTPMFGRIYGMASIKVTYLVSLALFILGSLICAIAPQSKVLIVGRAIAGLGSAGILSGSFIVAAHATPLKARPTYTGVVGLFFSIGSVVGPLIGGLFTSNAAVGGQRWGGWRWAFWLNLPVGLITIVAILCFLKEAPQSIKTDEEASTPPTDNTNKRNKDLNKTSTNTNDCNETDETKHTTPNNNSRNNPNYPLNLRRSAGHTRTHTRTHSENPNYINTDPNINVYTQPLFIPYYHELPPPPPPDPRQKLRTNLTQLDFIGNTLLLGAAIMFFLGLQFKNNGDPWTRARIPGLFAASAVTVALYTVWQLYRKENALIPPRIAFKRSVAASCTVAFFLYGALLMQIYYMPFYFQAIKGRNAIGSGIDMLALVIPGALGSLFAGIAVSKVGYFAPFAITGTALATIGSGLLCTLEVDTPSSQWIGYSVIIGLGMGIAVQQGFIAVQTVLSPQDVAIGTAAVTFFQSLGGAVFVSIGDTLVITRLERAAQSMQLQGVDVRAVVEAGATEFMEVTPPAQLPTLLRVYNDGLRWVFICAAALYACAFLASFGIEFRSVRHESERRAEEAASHKAKSRENVGEEGKSEKQGEESDIVDAVGQNASAADTSETTNEPSAEDTAASNEQGSPTEEPSHSEKPKRRSWLQRLSQRKSKDEETTKEPRPSKDEAPHPEDEPASDAPKRRSWLERFSRNKTPRNSTQDTIQEDKSEIGRAV